jgi:hypothetical protein
MGVLEDVRNWLKEYPLWQELEKIPRRTNEIEAHSGGVDAGHATETSSRQP